MILNFAVAFVSVFAFAILLNIPRRNYLFCGLVGGLAWVVYLLVMGITGRESVACFFASLALSLLSRYASVALKTPTIVFLIPGIIPLVPGAGIYYTAFYLFAGNTSLAVAKGMETLAMAGSISLGILLAFSVPQRCFDWIAPRCSAPPSSSGS